MASMDTPEGDVFAIQSGAMEPLPLYVEEETALSRLQALVAALPHPSSHLHPLDPDTVNAFIESQTMVQPGTKSTGPPEPIMEYPGSAFQQPINEVMRIRQAIVTGFFDAISKGQGETIELFINRNLVTANTTNEWKKTPLLAAVAAKNVRIVQELLDFGADVNAFGVQV
jgi:Ankyrin repeat